MQYGLCIDGTRHGVTHDTVEGKSLIPPPGRWMKTSGGGLPPSLSDDSFSGSSALSSTSSCPCYSPDFCLWPCALCSPSLLSHSCLRLSHLHPPFYQATTSQRLSEVFTTPDSGFPLPTGPRPAGQHLTHITSLPWWGPTPSPPPFSHLALVFMFLGHPPPQCPRGFLPAGTPPTVLFYFFLPRHPHGQAPGLVPH